MKRIFCGCVSALLLSALPVTASVLAEQRIHGQTASPSMEISDGYVLDFPVAAPYGETVSLAGAEDELPAVYDPRTENIPLNAIQNRTRTEDIWAYQAASALELSTYKAFGQMPKYSEHHMLASMTFDRNNPFSSPKVDGGNRLFSTAYMARGSGPVLQSAFHSGDYLDFLATNGNTDPNTPGDNTYDSSLLNVGEKQRNFIPVEFLTAASEGSYSHRFADSPSEGLNTNYYKIKKAVHQYGAVTTDYYMHEVDSTGQATEYYNPETSAYFFRARTFSQDDQPYDSQGQLIPANGTVTIVGWDDNFPIDHFSTKNRPPQNGAWIVRTDRGTDWADGGYMYISYYDHMLGRNASVYKPQPGTYKEIYQYDPLLNLSTSVLNPDSYKTNSITLKNSDILWIGNRFEKTTGSPEEITAVGFYLQSYNYIAELYIDPSPEGDAPGSGYGNDLRPVPLKNGDLGLPTQISFPSPGYYILELEEPIKITGAFDVVLRLENVQTSGSGMHSIVLGFAADGNSVNGGITQNGKSFFSTNPASGFTALDRAVTNFGAVNLNMKAYTNVEDISFIAEKTEDGLLLRLQDDEIEKYHGAKVITAFYDEKKALLSAAAADLPAFTESAGEFPSSTLLIENADIPAGSIRARSFIWDGVDTMVPVTEMTAEITF